MAHPPKPQDKTERRIPSWSQAETIALRVRRWRQRSPLWWLLPGGLGLFGCMLIVGAITYSILTEQREREQHRPNPALTTTANGTPVVVLGTSQRSDPVAPTEPAEKPLTIVLLGSDRRPAEGIIGRTDSIHIVAIDPDGKGAGILALPRDLYVTIPGQGKDRINLVFAYGARTGVQSAADLLRETLADNFGIRMDHFVYVDFTVFITLVDAIGGIDLNVPYTIDDPLYPDDNYGYEPFYLEAGLQHLDGATALKYVRSRHQTNDFYRARRQQQVMLAIRDRILDYDLLPVLLPRIPTLYTSLANGYKTDLTPDQIGALALELKDIEEEAIRTGVVDDTATLPFTTPEGASVLVPDTAKVLELIETVLYP